MSGYITDAIADARGSSGELDVQKLANALVDGLAADEKRILKAGRPVDLADLVEALNLQELKTVLMTVSQDDAPAYRPLYVIQKIAREGNMMGGDAGKGLDMTPIIEAFREDPDSLAEIFSLKNTGPFPSNISENEGSRWSDYFDSTIQIMSARRSPYMEALLDTAAKKPAAVASLLESGNGYLATAVKDWVISKFPSCKLPTVETGDEEDAPHPPTGSDLKTHFVRKLAAATCSPP